MRFRAVGLTTRALWAEAPRRCTQRQMFPPSWHYSSRWWRESEDKRRCAWCRGRRCSLFATRVRPGRVPGHFAMCEGREQSRSHDGEHHLFSIRVSRWPWRRNWTWPYSSRSGCAAIWFLEERRILHIRKIRQQWRWWSTPSASSNRQQCKECRCPKR